MFYRRRAVELQNFLGIKSLQAVKFEIVGPLGQALIQDRSAANTILIRPHLPTSFRLKTPSAARLTLDFDPRPIDYALTKRL